MRRAYRREPFRLILSCLYRVDTEYNEGISKGAGYKTVTNIQLLGVFSVYEYEIKYYRQIMGFTAFGE